MQELLHKHLMSRRGLRFTAVFCTLAFFTLKQHYCKEHDGDSMELMHESSWQAEMCAMAEQKEQYVGVLLITALLLSSGVVEWSAKRMRSG